MCLDRIYNKKEKKDFLDKINEWFEVYKIVDISKRQRGDKWISDLRNYTYKYGLNTCPKPNKITVSHVSGQKYSPYFHFFLHKEDAQRESNYYDAQTITCYIRKAWISTVGYQFRCPSVVAKKAIFPKCPKIDLDLDEQIKFKILKESQVIRYPSH